MCTAIGLVDRDELDAATRASLAATLGDQYRTATDGATHTAAGWALRRWQGPLPAIAPTRGLPQGRQWFVNEHGLTMILIRPGAFTMGDPASPVLKPHHVTLTRTLVMSQSEVPVGLFDRFLADATCPAAQEPSDCQPDRGVSPAPTARRSASPGPAPPCFAIG